MRNLTDKAKKKDRGRVKRAAQAIYLAPTRREALRAAGRFRRRFEHSYPDIVRCLQTDIEELLTFFLFDDPEWRKATRTTNAIERRFVEVRRRTRPMGVFSDRTSIDRILYAIFTRENHQQGVPTLFPLTQSS